MYAYVHCSTLHNSKDMKSTQMPISDRPDKENVVSKHHQYYAFIKRNEIMSFAGTRMEQTNADTENQTLHVLTYK